MVKAESKSTETTKTPVKAKSTAKSGAYAKPTKRELLPSARWYLVNAENQILGRLASRIAMILSGKDQPQYERHKDHGAFVVVINSKKIKVTGKKLQDKTYKHFSGYPGGLRERSLSAMLESRPEYPIQHAVQGMLPKNSIGNHMLKKLKVYPQASHPHHAQRPVELKFDLKRKQK